MDSLTDTNVIPAKGADLVAEAVLRIHGKSLGLQVLRMVLEESQQYVALDKISNSGGEGVVMAMFLYVVISQLRAETQAKLQRTGGGPLILDNPFAKATTPPLPKWVLLSRTTAPTKNEDYSQIPWVPELGFWTELKSTQLIAAKVINDFMLRRRGNLSLVPIKERSLEIFGDEKRLDTMKTGDSLFSGRLSLSTLGAFQVPLPLPYRIANAPGKPVLVVENHNSYWSLGEWNLKTKCYAAVVYGAGEAFRSSGKALGQVLMEVNGTGAEYLGDLDIAGIQIPTGFNLALGHEGIGVAPALVLYRWLLENGRRRERTDTQTFIGGLAIEWLGQELGDALNNLWSQGQWIPQEALGHEQLVNSEFWNGASIA